MKETNPFAIEEISYEFTNPRKNTIFYEEKIKSKRRKNTSITPKKKKRKRK